MSPGGRLPHFWLDDGRSVYDLLGLEWTLLSINPESQREEWFAQTAREFGVELKIVSLDAAVAWPLYEASRVLFRPDHIVAWRSTASELIASDVFGKLLGFSAT